VNETCTWVHGSELCGKPAVEHVDLPVPGGKFIRIYLCADHSDQQHENLIENHVKPGLLRHK
jgi:hypothetical protein